MQNYLEFESNLDEPVQNLHANFEREITEKVKKGGFEEFNLEEDFSSFNLDDLLELSKTEGSRKFDSKYLKSGGFLPRLLFIYFLHLIIIVPFLILVLMLVGLIKGIRLMNEGRYMKGLLCVFFYFFDSILHTSYILCLISILLNSSDENYKNWNILCFSLYALYLFVMVAASLQSITSFVEFFQLEHLKYLGFRLINFFEKKILEKKGHDYEEIKKKFNTLFLDLNLDHSVFKYSTFGDTLETNPPQEFKKSYATNPLSNVLQINAKKKGDELLIDIYTYAKNKIRNEQTKFSKVIGYVIIVILVIILKILLPMYYLIKDDNNVDLTDSFGLFTVFFFYFQMMIAIFPLIASEDLKTKTMMLDRLNDHIDISRSKIVREMMDKSKDNNFILVVKKLLEKKGSMKINPSMNSEAELNNIEQLNKNNLHSYLFNLAMKEKIDTSCLFSIETWDNCRQATHHYDSQRSNLYESINLFLGIYSFFLIIILLSVIYDVYVVFAKDSPITSGFMLSIFSIDFSLFLVLFLHRIYYGNLYNDTFLKEQDSIHCLINIYEDLYRFYDYYINDEKIKTDNPFYDFFKKRVIERKEQIEIINANIFIDKKKNVSGFLKKYLKTVCKSLKQLKNDIDEDSKRYSHNFLGIFQSDFENMLIQLGVVMIPLIPSIYSYYYG